MGCFIQWHMVVVCIWCALFVTSKLTRLLVAFDCKQARNQGGAVGANPPKKFLPPLEKCVGHSLELFDNV